MSAPSSSRLGYDPVDIHDDDSYAAIYRYSVKDDKVTNALPRVSVLEFFYPGDRHTDRQQRRDIFLLAFQAMQQLPATNKWSFYQIAAIHGLPYVAYDGDESKWEAQADGTSAQWGGYCEHGSPLFPTWHRPYMMLFEQSIVRQAKLLAETRFQGEEIQTVTKIADELRVPFWDWANVYTGTIGIPDVFTSTEISLAYKWKSQGITPNIPNPLKSFVLPEDVGKPFPSSDVYNPAAKPNYVVPPTGTPFSPKGYPTVRHVSAAYQSQDDKLNLTVMRNADTSLRTGVHAMFYHTDWETFSNHFSQKTKKERQIKSFGHYSSLEFVHDLVHGAVGGGGQMQYPDSAAFDPIFFFHHSNVDRLTALWQYCYPHSWIDDEKQEIYDGTYTIEPGTIASSNTDLTPFRRSQAADEFVSSNDVRTVDVDCGYTYPEIKLAREKGWKPKKMLCYLLDMYRPPQSFNFTWFVVLEKIPKRPAFGVPYIIRVFLDKPDATKDTPLTDPHFAGILSVFARSNEARCVNCDRNENNIRGSLDITSTMLLLGIATIEQLNGDISKTNEVSAPSFNITLVLVSAGGDHARQLDPAQIGWTPEPTVYWRAAIVGETDNTSSDEEEEEEMRNARPALRGVGKAELTKKTGEHWECGGVPGELLHSGRAVAKGKGAKGKGAAKSKGAAKRKRT